MASAKAKAEDLLFVSKSKKERLEYLAAGASLVSRTGCQIEDLRKKAVQDRIKFAAILHAQANALMTSSVGQNRTIISRAYYSMYHSARAITYMAFGGDDHEEHTVLPGKLPEEFPDVTRWRNALRSARLERNKADYDPYPRNDKDFASAARSMVKEAEELLVVVRRFVRRKL